MIVAGVGGPPGFHTFHEVFDDLGVYPVLGEGVDWAIWPGYMKASTFAFGEIRFGFEVSLVPVSLVHVSPANAVLVFGR